MSAPVKPVPSSASATSRANDCSAISCGHQPFLIVVCHASTIGLIQRLRLNNS